MPQENRTRFALLGFLNQGPRSGYDLRKEFEERTAHFWSESLGQVYPTLHRLHREGLVLRETVRQENRPDRIIYSITEDGRAELERWIEEPSSPQPVRNEQLLKLYFASSAQAGALLADVRADRERYRAQLQHFAAFTEVIPKLAPTPEKATLWLLNLSLGKRIVQARADWCEEAVSVLAEMAGEDCT